MAGSPRALTPPISRKLGGYWSSWRGSADRAVQGTETHGGCSGLSTVTLRGIMVLSLLRGERLMPALVTEIVRGQPYQYCSLHASGLPHVGVERDVDGHD